MTEQGLGPGDDSGQVQHPSPSDGPIPPSAVEPSIAPVSGLPVLARLSPVNPREVWKHEAHDFTPWLLDNADVLSDLLGMELELHEAEHPVGDFSLDLLGKDLATGETVIVENQLEQSDHLHLGQILTYAAGTDPTTIVWVNTNFRPEHRAALDWLNERTNEKTRFFGVEINVVRIGSSPAAPSFRLVAQPNDWEKNVRQSVSSASGGERSALYASLWERWRQLLNEKHPGWSKAQRTSRQSWFQFSMGVSGVDLVQAFTKRGLAVQFQFGSADGIENERRYGLIEERKTEVEKAFGPGLEWELLPDNKVSRIATYTEGAITETERWDEYLTWFLKRTVAMRNAVLSTGGVPH